MPELPEVETTLRGIQPHISSQRINAMIVRHYRLRWPIAEDICQKLKGKKIIGISRRAKYLLFQCDHGTLIVHLGMSGSLRILLEDTPPQKHDHFDIEFDNHKILRYTDPRRFGACLWTHEDPLSHPLLKHLGVEPLERSFSTTYLWQALQNRTTSIKSLLMDHTLVVGIGNIYATEVLFLAGLHPLTPAKQLSKESCTLLVKLIKGILRQAIQQGGSTIRDFTKSDGKPGYFAQRLKVYGRSGLPCLQCHTTLKTLRIGQRSTVYCAHCQS